MKELVRNLLLGANQYSLRELPSETVAALECLLWKDWAAQKATGDVFGDKIAKIVKDFEMWCRKRIQ